MLNETDNMQARLAQSRLGRIILHVACACRDHKCSWHWHGVVREIVSLEPFWFLRNPVST